MRSVLNLELDESLSHGLAELSQLSGKSPHDIAQEALLGHVFKARWELLTLDMVEQARRQSVFTDDNVMRLCEVFRVEQGAQATAAEPSKGPGL